MAKIILFFNNAYKAKLTLLFSLNIFVFINKLYTRAALETRLNHPSLLTLLQPYSLVNNNSLQRFCERDLEKRPT